ETHQRECQIMFRKRHQGQRYRSDHDGHDGVKAAFTRAIGTPADEQLARQTEHGWKNDERRNGVVLEVEPCLKNARQKKIKRLTRAHTTEISHCQQQDLWI